MTVPTLAHHGTLLKSDGNGTYEPAHGMKSGRWYLSSSLGTAVVALVDQREQWLPLDIDVATTFQAIGINVTVAGSAGSVVRLGISADDGSGSMPGALLHDYGTVDTSTSGAKSIAISPALVLQPGRYWPSGTAQGAPATNPTVRSWNTSQSDSRVGLAALSDAFATCYLQSGVAGALPANATVSADGAGGPMIALQVA